MFELFREEVQAHADTLAAGLIDARGGRGRPDADRAADAGGPLDQGRGPHRQHRHRGAAGARDGGRARRRAGRQDPAHPVRHRHAAEGRGRARGAGRPDPRHGRVVGGEQRRRGGRAGAAVRRDGARRTHPGPPRLLGGANPPRVPPATALLPGKGEADVAAACGSREVHTAREAAAVSPPSLLRPRSSRRASRRSRSRSAPTTPCSTCSAKRPAGTFRPSRRRCPRSPTDPTAAEPVLEGLKQLRGAARLVKCEPVAAVAAAVGGFLRAAREGRCELSPPALDWARYAVAALAGALATDDDTFPAWADGSRATLVAIAETFTARRDRADRDSPRRCSEARSRPRSPARGHDGPARYARADRGADGPAFTRAATPRRFARPRGAGRGSGGAGDGPEPQPADGAGRRVAGAGTVAAAVLHRAARS